ncbi:MAG: class II aldolase/adducin family protein [Planctomycetota bacterium]|jgi:rhamnose utilization protein RhaD (predicted bifunctional aldolase and dehydrogenase)
MDRALSELIRISNNVGKDRSLVQGVGGNTSVKSSDGKYMYVKASGTALENMGPAGGWRRVRTEPLNEIFRDKSLVRMDVAARESEMVRHLQSACDDPITGAVRPSIESLLHVILEKCVIHVHPWAVLAYACAKNGSARISELFEDEHYPPLWIPFADPGISLGLKAFRLVRSYRKQYDRNPSIMFLQKHGLVVASNSAAGVLELLRNVIARCKAGLAPLPAPTAPVPKQKDIDNIRQTIAQGILEVTGNSLPVSYFSDEIVSAALERKDLRKLLTPVALSPDEMGFVNGPVVLLTNLAQKTVTDRIKSTLSSAQKHPAAFLVKDVGLFIAADKKLVPIIRDLVVGSLFVRMHAQDMGGINALNKRQREFINNWEPEKFRIQLAGR